MSQASNYSTDAPTGGSVISCAQPTHAGPPRPTEYHPVSRSFRGVRALGPTAKAGPQRCDLGKFGGDDGNRTHDPLLAKQDLARARDASRCHPSPAIDRHDRVVVPGQQGVSCASWPIEDQQVPNRAHPDRQLGAEDLWLRSRLRQTPGGVATASRACEQSEKEIMRDWTPMAVELLVVLGEKLVPASDDPCADPDLGCQLFHLVRCAERFDPWR